MEDEDYIKTVGGYQIHIKDCKWIDFEYLED